MKMTAKGGDTTMGWNEITGNQLHSSTKKKSKVVPLLKKKMAFTECKLDLENGISTSYRSYTYTKKYGCQSTGN